MSWPPGPTAASATPLTRAPDALLVWLEGSPDATTVVVPWQEVLEMLAVSPPVQGADGQERSWSVADRLAYMAVRGSGVG